jgi:hypothetical protein
LTHTVLGGVGAWYSANDGSGQQFPDAPCFVPSPAGELAPHASAFAARTYGTDPISAEGYAQIGISFRSSPPACDGPLDASGMSGVRFLIRSAESTTIRLGVGTVATNPIDDGGSCLSDCYDSFMIDVQAGDGWTEYYVDFATLRQGGWSGVPVPWDSSTILNLTWQKELSGGVNACFDFWVDDVAFYRDP